MATQLEHKVDFEGQYLTTIKAGILALSKGLAPAIAVEFARRSIPSELRPSFSETEAYCRAPQGDAAQAEAA
jgi:chemotaxis protein MotA